MTTFYRTEGSSKWIELPENTDLYTFGRDYLERKGGGYDSDGCGYSAFLEYDTDGVRTYSYAEFRNFYETDYDEPGASIIGGLWSYDYGTAAKLGRQNMMDIIPLPFGPTRDWIVLGS